MAATHNADHEYQSSVAKAQVVARAFLAATLSDVKHVDITKVDSIALGNATWEAEAEVWQPNATLRNLGIDAGRPLLDHNRYLVRLDALLNVLEYKRKEPSQAMA